VSAVVSHVAWAYGFRVGSCALGNASTLPLLQPFPSPSYTCVPPLSLARSATLVHAVSSTCAQLAAGLAPECLGNDLGMSWECLGSKTPNVLLPNVSLPNDLRQNPHAGRTIIFRPAARGCALAARRLHTTIFFFCIHIDV